MTHISFNKKNSDLFEEIKERVEKYFCSNKISRYGNYKIYLKTFVFIFMALSAYIAMIVAPLPTFVYMLLSAFLGICFAGIGFNVMHDGAHGSYSDKKWLNELMGYSLNFMGGIVFIWKNKHNFNHHSYTNIEGMDDDIDIEPWIRTHASQPKRWYHKYQHIYGLVLYCITYLNWICLGDFKKYFTKKIANTPMHKMDLKEHLIFWFSKALYFFLFLALPIIKVGFLQGVLGFLLMACVCGFILGVVFQLAHLIDETEFPMPQEGSLKMESSWVLHQIATTVNFAITNKPLSWYTGGLNFQIVHHIFPKVSHIHYPKINVLIKEVCQKFDVTYTEFPTLFAALRSHLTYLKRLGTS